MGHIKKAIVAGFGAGIAAAAGVIGNAISTGNFTKEAASAAVGAFVVGVFVTLTGPAFWDWHRERRQRRDWPCARWM